jgi:hypothetical protein
MIRMSRWKISRCVPAALAMLALVTAALAQDAAEIKPEIGTPVIDDLMGGCSLTCSFPWSAMTEGDRESKIAAVNDSLSATAWTEARVGDRLKFQFPANLPRELNGTPFYGVDFANGAVKPLREFSAYGRLKKVLLRHNGRAVHTFRLADNWRWQHFTFPDIFLNVGDTLELEILEIYPGKKHPTAAITEIVLQGAH